MKFPKFSENTRNLCYADDILFGAGMCTFASWKFPNKFSYFSHTIQGGKCPPLQVGHSLITFMFKIWNFYGQCSTWKVDITPPKHVYLVKYFNFLESFNTLFLIFLLSDVKYGHNPSTRNFSLCKNDCEAKNAHNVQTCFTVYEWNIFLIFYRFWSTKNSHFII